MSRLAASNPECEAISASRRRSARAADLLIAEIDQLCDSTLARPTLGQDEENEEHNEESSPFNCTAKSLAAIRAQIDRLSIQKQLAAQDIATEFQADLQCVRVEVAAKMDNVRSELRTELRAELQSALAVIGSWIDGDDESEGAWEAADADGASLAASFRRRGSEDDSGREIEESQRSSNTEVIHLDDVHPRAASLDSVLAPESLDSITARDAEPSMLKPRRDTEETDETCQTALSSPLQSCASAASSVPAQSTTSLGLADIQSLVAQQVSQQVQQEMAEQVAAQVAMQVNKAVAEQLRARASAETELAELRAAHRQTCTELEARRAELEAERRSKAALQLQLASAGSGQLAQAPIMAQFATPELVGSRSRLKKEESRQ